MPSEAAMRAAKAIAKSIHGGKQLDQPKWAAIIDREMESFLNRTAKCGKRVYICGKANTICANCGHFVDKHNAGGECPDHNWSVTCCGGVPQ